MNKIKLLNKDGSLIIHIYFDVSYGIKIPDLAWKIQKNVTDAVAEYTEVPVSQVNIHVQGVKMRKKDNLI